MRARQNEVVAKGAGRARQRSDDLRDRVRAFALHLGPGRVDVLLLVIVSHSANSARIPPLTAVTGDLTQAIIMVSNMDPSERLPTRAPGLTDALADWLATRTPEQLRQLAARRPDALTPPPPSLHSLATRLTITGSLRRVVEHLSAPELAACEALERAFVAAPSVIDLVAPRYAEPSRTGYTGCVAPPWPSAHPLAPARASPIRASRGPVCG